jgi:hypothetical protein
MAKHNTPHSTQNYTNNKGHITHKEYNTKKVKLSLQHGRGGLWGYEVSRIPHCLDNRLTDTGKVVSHTHRPLFTPRNLAVLIYVTYYQKMFLGVKRGLRVRLTTSPPSKS